MTAQHTPGPWINVGAWVEHPDDSIPDICNCNPDSMDQEGRSYDEVCATARLIAAAPELLDALVMMLDAYDIPAVRQQARSAIAKAIGGAA